MAYRSGSTTTDGNGTSSVITVPTGAASGDIAVVTLYLESNAAITPPAGFTQKADIDSANAATHGREITFWKRLTAADTGSYTFSWTGSTWSQGACVLYSGRSTTGDPFEATNTLTAATDTTPDVPGVTASAGADLFCSISQFATASTWTAPTGMTTRTSTAGQGVIATATQDNLAGGATGTLTWTLNASGFAHGFVGSLHAASSTTPISGSDSVAESEGAPTLVAESTRTDSATATDSTSAVAVSVAATDSATVSDASSVDVGSTPKSASDALTVTDTTSTVVAASTRTDTLTVADASSLAIVQAVAGTDAASLTDAVDQVVLTDNAAEGILTETAALSATFTRTDTATFADSASVTVVGTNPSTSDTAAMFESSSVVVTLSATDALTVTETSTAAVTLTALETAAISEQRSLLAAVVTSDSWIVTDLGSVGTVGVDDGTPVRQPSLTLTSASSRLALTSPTSTLELDA